MTPVRARQHAQAEECVVVMERALPEGAHAPWASVGPIAARARRVTTITRRAPSVARQPTATAVVYVARAEHAFALAGTLVRPVSIATPSHATGMVRRSRTAHVPAVSAMLDQTVSAVRWVSWVIQRVVGMLAQA